MKELKECNKLNNKFTTTYCDANNDSFNLFNYNDELNFISDKINQKIKDFIKHFRIDSNKQECIKTKLNIISKNEKCGPYKPEGIELFFLVNKKNNSSIIKVCEEINQLANKNEISFDDLSKLNKHVDKVLVVKKPNDVYDQKAYDNKIVIYSIFNVINVKNLANMIFSLFLTYQNYNEDFVRNNYFINLDSVGYYVS